LATLIDWIIYFLVLFIPFFLIVILPFMLSWIFGAKELRKTQDKYLRILLEWARRKKLKLSGKESSILKLVVSFSSEKPAGLITVIITLIERRNWVWYFLKLIRKTPSDRFLIQVESVRPPSALLYMIPLTRRKILTKIAGYLANLMSLSGIIESYSIYSDDPTAANYFTRKIITLSENAEKYIDYVIVDYASPHIEISGKVKKGHELLYSLELALSLLQRFPFVKGKRPREDIAKFLRKALME